VRTEKVLEGLQFSGRGMVRTGSATRKDCRLPERVALRIKDCAIPTR
jgi:hypothetical protein